MSTDSNLERFYYCFAKEFIRSCSYKQLISLMGISNKAWKGKKRRERENAEKVKSVAEASK